jgi:PST family polysaccharide transporter
MSLAVKATRSAAWMFGAGIVTRVAGLLGTLVVVRWIAPADYGEAIGATILVQTATTLSTFGIGQYVIVRAAGDRALAFHATVVQLVLGLGALALLFAFGGPIGDWVNVKDLARYLPPLALSMVLDRLWLVPERVLMRDLRFRRVALARSGGEVAYTVCSVALAALGWGGMAIAAGNVARSAVRAAGMLPAVGRRDWLEVHPLRREVILDIFRFGAPLAVAHIAGTVAQKWDNLLVSRFFGAATMASYNLAYNLAWMAAAAIADHVTDILVPSFALAEPERRPDALLRGARLLALLTTPLCLGLAAVSTSLVASVFDPRWASVGPMLSILGVAAAMNPLIYLVVGYLQARSRSGLVMNVLLALVVGIIGAIALLGRFGPLWTCVAVGLGMLVSVLTAGVAVRATDGISVTRLLATQARPLVACLPMVAAVLGVRLGLSRAGIDVRLSLAAEILAGAATYVAAAFVVARPVTDDLLRLVRTSFLRRGPRAEEATPAPAAATSGDSGS